MKLLDLVLLTLPLLSHYCSESQRSEVAIYDGSGHIPISVEQLSGNGAMDKKARKRCFRRRKQRLVKWCESRMKAKEIDSEVEWKKIIGATVFVLGLVHVLFFCHPVCHRIKE